jgi:hypothetical protein
MEKAGPSSCPSGTYFERGVFRIATGTTSHKANVLRVNQRAYFTVDTGGNYGDTRGVRGPATVRIIDGDVGLAIDVARKGLLKYTGTDKGPTPTSC